MANNLSNYDWFIEKDLSSYAGKWLAIINKNVVAYNDDVTKLLNEVRIKYPKKRLFITKIRSKLSIL